MLQGSVNDRSPPNEKITLFRSLFRGFEDVYPRRFESRTTGKTGYSPVCNNEWVSGICEKPRVKCAMRAFEDALNRLRQTVGENYYPMLIVPYLREKQLEQLAEEQPSGIDLSGNGIVCIPGKLLVFRTGKPNKYPDSAPTKYAYRGTTSLVARTFLCRPSFGSRHRAR